MSLSELLEAHRRERERLVWEGSFRDYFELVTGNPRLSSLSHARICDMILASDTEKIAEGTRDEITRYKFFSDELFGIEEPIARVVEYFKSAAQRLEVRKRILLLMGPVGGGKSTIVSMLKRGLEQWAQTEVGAVYAIKNCPMHEEPLHLIPPELRQEIEKHYGLYIEGELCPQCRYNLDHVYHGKHEDVLIERIAFSEKDRIGIGTFAPSDPKSQDITELTGSIDLSTIGEIGVESDPRAYRFDGELNIANRGLMEFIEILKCITPSSYVTTEHGLLQIRELAPPRPDAHRDFAFEAKLLTRDGVRQTSHLIYNGEGQTIRVETGKGYMLEGSPDHRILVRSASGKLEWKHLRELTASDWVPISRNGYWPELPARLPGTEQLSFNRLKLPEMMTPNLARLLGYFVAEGSYLKWREKDYGIRISATSDEVIADLRSIAAELGFELGGQGADHQIHSKELADLFHLFGFDGRRAHEKHVPQIIRRSSKKIVSAFLRAYFDGDGTATNFVACTTASEKLAEQIQLLLLNYGIVAKRRARWNEKYERYYYTIEIAGENIAVFNREIGFGLDYKRLTAERLATEAHDSHRDVLPNLHPQWTQMAQQLQTIAVTAHAASNAGYRQRAGVRQMIGDMNYEQLWRFAGAKSVPSYRVAETITQAAQPFVGVPEEISEALNTRFFYDRIEQISEGHSDLWDFCVPDEHTYVSNGFISHNCDEKFLYSLLTLSQEQNIKTGRFAMIYADEVIISHTNENEYTAFVGNRKSEALQDRIIMVKVPYNLKVTQEERIYDKLLKQSEAMRSIHLAPNTLKVAAMFAVMSRLEEPKKANVDIVKKMKLYDGEDVEGFKSKDVRELQDETVREGMDGISPRYVINRLSNALVKDNIHCINPIDALRAIKDGFDQHTGIKTEEKERYLSLISQARREYDNISKTEVQRAFVYSFEEMAKNMCNSYLDNVEAYCNKEKIKDPITEEELEADERLMRSIEEQIGISENAKNTFRQEILIRISSYSRKGKTFDYNSHERLKEAIEKKIFSDLKDVVKITTSAKTPDADQLRRINEVIDRLVSDHGYCTICANELLSYVGTLLSR
ncbi:MAG: LAGLIDADG family homing endonuclease [Blastocatellia bacterium]